MKMPNTVIREEIKRDGVISFARFMEIALYCPETGYYETEKDIVGRAGDFITSVSTGSLFGHLLAWQLAVWLEELSPRFESLNLIEAGAHDGRLAGDILGWLQTNRPQFFSRLEYGILEPSPKRKAWQAKTLEIFAPQVRWYENFSALRAANPQLAGVIFSNELLDAFPVRRLGWDAANQSWFEWGVTVEAEHLVWSRICGSPTELSLPNAIRNLPPALLQVLPDGYTLEVSPAAERWWQNAAWSLTDGRLMTIDYGFTSEGMLVPGRLRGTLRAYHRHRVTDDLLANPGEQDLTAHVNFSAIQAAGEGAGLTTESFSAQPRFLTHILERALAVKNFEALSPSEIRQFQTLTHPEHLGRAFSVLIQRSAD